MKKKTSKPDSPKEYSYSVLLDPPMTESLVVFTGLCPNGSFNDDDDRVLGILLDDDDKHHKIGATGTLIVGDCSRTVRLGFDLSYNTSYNTINGVLKDFEKARKKLSRIRDCLFEVEKYLKQSEKDFIAFMNLHPPHLERREKK